MNFALTKRIPSAENKVGGSSARSEHLLDVSNYANKRTHEDAEI